MALSAYYRRPALTRRPRIGPAQTAARRRPPPSAALINAVLEHADLRDELGGGRVMLRLSPAALRRLDIGAETTRLADLAVIWDEREESIFRVLDGGPPPIAPVPAAETVEVDDGRGAYALTPRALAYIAESQSQSRRRG
jgi:hypothetical protein